jgi:hypothetical protein
MSGICEVDVGNIYISTELGCSDFLCNFLRIAGINQESTIIFENRVNKCRIGTGVPRCWGKTTRKE